MISAVVEPELLRDLVADADKLGCSISDVIRWRLRSGRCPAIERSAAA
jgi:hypothetical protein